MEKHIDTRYKNVNEYVEDGMVKIVFVNSADDELIESFTSTQKIWQTRSLINFQNWRIFKDKKNDDNNDILSSNIQFGIILWAGKTKK